MLHSVVGPKEFGQYLVSKHSKSPSTKRTLALGLMLTPMVDMFSLLVIFLLQVFSTSPEFLVAPGVTLPRSISGGDIKDAPILALNAEEVYLDQKRIGTIKETMTNPTALAEALEQIRAQWSDSHPEQNFLGEINLQAHESLPSTMVAHFMAILSSQHFGSIQLIAIPGGKLS